MQKIADLSQEIDSRDTMYTGDREHYFGVAYSALKCINIALSIADKQTVDSILDFPSGYGRVTRMLKATFPHARLAVGDLDYDAVNFCVNAFNSIPIYSKVNANEIAVDDSFDVIWCGSLLTHLDLPRWLDFINFFKSNLNPSGVMVFTTHGRLSAEWLKTRQNTYGLNESQISDLLRNYDINGFGYSDYANAAGYGISVTSPAWVLSQIQTMPDVRLLNYTEAGWDNHQDVIACVRL